VPVSTCLEHLHTCCFVRSRAATSIFASTIIESCVRQCDCFVASRKLEVRQTSLPCSTIMAVKACTAGASTIKEVATSHTLPQAALYVQPSSWHSSKPRETAETCWFCRPVVLQSDGHSYHTEPRMRAKAKEQCEGCCAVLLKCEVRPGKVGLCV